MPLNASPVTTTVVAFEEKLRAARGNGQTGTVDHYMPNAGFWGGIIPPKRK